MQFFEQIQDLGLDRNIEGGSGFIQYQQLRFQNQRPRQRDALALSTGEFVGVAIHMLNTKTDAFEHGQDHLIDLITMGQTVKFKSDADEVADRLARMQ